MLSLGDRREAVLNTRLLYHGVRVVANGFLTAEQAQHQANCMGKIDAAVLARLADRALKAAVGDLTRARADG